MIEKTIFSHIERERKLFSKVYSLCFIDEVVKYKQEYWSIISVGDTIFCIFFSLFLWKYQYFHCFYALKSERVVPNYLLV